MIFAAISVVVNVALALTLFPRIGVAGIATAEAVAGWVNATLLFGTLVWRGHWGRDIAAPDAHSRLVFAAAVMAGALYFAIELFAALSRIGLPALYAGRHGRSPGLRQPW